MMQRPLPRLPKKAPAPVAQPQPAMDWSQFAQPVQPQPMQPAPTQQVSAASIDEILKKYREGLANKPQYPQPMR